MKSGVVVVLFLQYFASLASGCYGASAQSAGGETVHFDIYSDGQHGPAHWHELKPEWAVCKTGMQQSPIHITADGIVTDRKLGKLKALYRKRISATIANDGHTVVVDLPSHSGILKINGVTYRPAQFHFHMPSEHVLMNMSFPLEMHLVHKSEDGNLAVIAFLFLEGEESEFLAQLADKLPSFETPHVKHDIGKIRLLQLNRDSYGRYMGSLTTPPCAENVTWTAMIRNFPTASAQQLNALRDSVPHTNNRPAFSSQGRNFRTSF